MPGSAGLARAGAFSLLELLAAVALMALLTSLALPAVSGFLSVAGRRGAATTIMSTFEQARVAAIEAGRPVHVIFCRRSFPEPDAVMVVREPEETSNPLEPLTQWIRLPKGVLLHDPGSVNILSQPTLAADFIKRLSSPVPSAPGEKLNLVTFNSSGGVDYPSGGGPSRQLYLSEGVRGAGGNESVISNQKMRQCPGGGFEVISLSRYTGRAQFDTTGI